MNFRNTSSFSKKLKSIGRNYYFLQSGTKITSCVALMRLIQGYKASLNDSVCKYFPEFPEDVTLRIMITEYSGATDSEDSIFCFSNTKKLIETIADMPFEEYIALKITEPLKMKQTSFNLTSKSRKKIALQYRFDETSDRFVGYNADVEAITKRNDGCIITTVDDYAKFCEAMCSGEISQNGYQLLTKESVDLLINELIYWFRTDGCKWQFEPYRTVRIYNRNFSTFRDYNMTHQLQFTIFIHIFFCSYTSCFLLCF